MLVPVLTTHDALRALTHHPCSYLSSLPTTHCAHSRTTHARTCPHYPRRTACTHAPPMLVPVLTTHDALRALTHHPCSYLSSLPTTHCARSRTTHARTCPHYPRRTARTHAPPMLVPALTTHDALRAQCV